MHRITIMSKPGCHLCEQMEDAIRRVVRVPIVIDVVDITKEQDLLEKYQNDIPVVLVDGVEQFRHKVDPQKLTALLMDEPGEQLPGITG